MRGNPLYKLTNDGLRHQGHLGQKSRAMLTDETIHKQMTPSDWEYDNFLNLFGHNFMSRSSLLETLQIPPDYQDMIENVDRLISRAVSEGFIAVIGDSRSEIIGMTPELSDLLGPGNRLNEPDNVTVTIRRSEYERLLSAAQDLESLHKVNHRLCKVLACEFPGCTAFHVHDRAHSLSVYHGCKDIVWCERCEVDQLRHYCNYHAGDVLIYQADKDEWICKSCFNKRR